MLERATDSEFSDRIGEVIDQSTDLSARFLSDRTDLSASAAFALNRVRREGPIRLTALAAKEGVSQPSMTQLIQRLEHAGLVTRIADPDDGRATLICLSAEGHTVLEERRRGRRQHLAALLATLSTEEQSSLWLAAEVMYPILSRMVTNADHGCSGVVDIRRRTADTNDVVHGGANHKRKVLG